MSEGPGPSGDATESPQLSAFASDLVTDGPICAKLIYEQIQLAVIPIRQSDPF